MPFWIFYATSLLNLPSRHTVLIRFHVTIYPQEMVGKAFAGPFPEDRFYVRAIVAILLPFWHWDLPCFRRRLAVLGTARDGRTEHGFQLM